MKHLITAALLYEKTNYIMVWELSYLTKINGSNRKVWQYEYECN